MASFPPIPDITGLSSDISSLTDGLSSVSNIASSVSSNVSGILGGTSNSSQTNNSNLTKNDERLHIIRSRAAKVLYDNKGKDTYTSDRGPITTMKILPGPGYDPVESIKGARSTVEQDARDLVEGRFVNFFLTDIQISFNEKMQVTQTFGDNEVVYYFGRQPLIMNISGLLFDSLENDWFSKFMTLYAGMLRGTQLAKSFSLVRITFPNMIVTGTVAGLSINQNSQRDTDIPFQMQFVAKEVEPIPVPVVTGTATNLRGTLIDWRANRTGVEGYTLSTGGLGGGFMESPILSFGKGGVLGSLSSSVDKINGGLSSLTSFRTNIFTPVFGVISSITKIVKSVTGSITSIISSFTNPVNQVLRDIQSVASKAVGVAHLIENSVNSVVSIPLRTVANIQGTIRSLKSAAGTISRTPENISQSLKRLNNIGRIGKSSSLLVGGKNKNKSKAAVLNSGAPYTPTLSNKL